MIVPTPVCMRCIHLLPIAPFMKCKAFPDGIPEEILLDGNQHQEAVPGDHGFRFEASPYPYFGKVKEMLDLSGLTEKLLAMWGMKAVM